MRSNGAFPAGQAPHSEIPAGMTWVACEPHAGVDAPEIIARPYCNGDSDRAARQTRIGSGRIHGRSRLAALQQCGDRQSGNHLEEDCEIQSCFCSHDRNGFEGEMIHAVSVCQVSVEVQIIGPHLRMLEMHPQLCEIINPGC